MVLSSGLSWASPLISTVTNWTNQCYALFSALQRKSAGRVVEFMSAIGTSHCRLWCSWRWALSTHLVPLQVSCHLSPFETTLPNLEAYELNKSWSLKIHVPPWIWGKLPWKYKQGYVLKELYDKCRCALSLLAWAPAGLFSPSTASLVEARGCNFCSLKCRKISYLSVYDPSSFLTCYCCISCRSMQGKARPSGLLLQKSLKGCCCLGPKYY